MWGNILQISKKARPGRQTGSYLNKYNGWHAVATRA